MGNLGRPKVVEAETLFEGRTILINTDFAPTDLLQEIITPGWRASPSLQEDTLCKIHAVWAGFSDRQRYEAFGNCRAHVNRLVITRGGEQAQWDLFNAIMQLPDEVSVRRALMWDPDNWRPYVPEEWEKPYLDLPGFVGDFVRCYKESSVPAPFFAWAAIGLLSVCCKYNIYIQAGGEELLHNLYLFFVGDSAVGKSYAKNCATTVISILNERLNTTVAPPPGPDGVPYTIVYDRPDLWINTLSQDGTYEGGIARLAAIRKIPIQKLIQSPSTGQQFLSASGRFSDAAAVLVVDEVSEHFGRGDWAADKKVAGYTAMYTGKSRSKSTVGSGEMYYDRQAFSMMVCGAVEWFKGAVTPAMLHGGFMDRAMFLYRQGTNRIYTALDMPIIDPIQEVALADKLLGVVVPPDGMRRRVSISDGAKAYLADVSTLEFQAEIDIRNQKVAKSEVYKSSAVRREHLKIKLASLLTISDSVRVGEVLNIAPVSKDHMALSEMLVTAEDSYFQRFLDAVNLTGATIFNGWLYDQFLKAEWEALPQRSLLSKAYKVEKFDIKTVEDLVKKMDILAEGGVITTLKMPVPGRGKKTGLTTVGYKATDNRETWQPYLP